MLSNAIDTKRVRQIKSLRSTGQMQRPAPFSARTRSFGLTDRNQDPHATIEMDLSEPAVQTIGIVAV